jgi:carboxymethylenebutenolidase
VIRQRLAALLAIVVLCAFTAHAADVSETISIAPNVTGQLVKPSGAGKHAAVLIVHDSKGPSGQTQNVARRLAAQGYLALVVDFGSDPAKLAAIPWKQAVADLSAAMKLLRARADSNGKVGAVGFGWGGTMVNNLALNETTLTAVAAYYGLQPIYYQEDDYRAAGAAMLAHYAGRDIMTNQGIGAIKYELSTVNKTMESYVYPRVERGFDAEGSTTYNKPAADQAWQRTLAFFKKHLG